MKLEEILNIIPESEPFLLYDYATEKKIKASYNNENLSIYNNMEVKSIYVGIDYYSHPMLHVCINMEETEK